MSTVTQRIQSVIVKYLGVDAAEVTANAALHDDLGADGNDISEIVMLIEEEFNIEIPDSAEASMKKVSDLINFITAKLPK